MHGRIARINTFSTEDPGVFKSELLVFGGDDSAKRLGDAMEFVITTGGDLFWGIELELDDELQPQTLDRKLGILRDTILLVPEIEDREPHIYSWASGEINQDPEKVEKLATRISSIMLDHTLGKKFPNAPKDANGVLKKPTIYNSAHDQLVESGDPVTFVLDAYTHYADRSTNIEEHARTLGDKVLRHFMFAAGGQHFLEVLGEANRRFFEEKAAPRKIIR